MDGSGQQTAPADCSACGRGPCQYDLCQKQNEGCQSSWLVKITISILRTKSVFDHNEKLN